jgi:hypothetical protein
MKGMRKISRGSGFRGALDYVFERENGKEKGRLIGGNLSGTTPEALSSEFGVARRLRPAIKKPVWHNSLRLPANEQLNDSQWIEFADDYMKRMGFSGHHPRVYVMHDDKGGQHIHIVASRISLSGELYLGQNENLISTRIISELEKKYDLTITKGVEKYGDNNEKIVQPGAKKPKKKEIEKSLRTGDKPPRQRLQQLIDDAIKERPSAIKFAEKLEFAGVKVRANIASTGKMNGFSFVFDGAQFSGSQLGDKYKWSSLLKRGLTFNSMTDAVGLERFKPAANIESDQSDDEILGQYSCYLIKFLNQKIRQNGIEYTWQNGSPALFDAGSSVKIVGKASDAKIKAMFELADQKGWKTVSLTGSGDFKKRALIEAVRRGITVLNPELQELIRAEHSKFEPSAHTINILKPRTTRQQLEPHSEEFIAGKMKKKMDDIKVATDIEEGKEIENEKNVTSNRPT